MSVKLNYKNITRDLMKSIRHYAMLCIEYGAISGIMVIRAGYKHPIYPGGA